MRRVEAKMLPPKMRRRRGDSESLTFRVPSDLRPWLAAKVKAGRGKTDVLVEAMQLERDFEEVLGGALVKKLLAIAERERTAPGAVLARLVRDVLTGHE